MNKQKCNDCSFCLFTQERHPNGKIRLKCKAKDNQLIIERQDKTILFQAFDPEYESSPEWCPLQQPIDNPILPLDDNIYFLEIIIMCGDFPVEGRTTIHSSFIPKRGEVITYPFDELQNGGLNSMSFIVDEVHHVINKDHTAVTIVNCYPLQTAFTSEYVIQCLIDEKFEILEDD